MSVCFLNHLLTNSFRLIRERAVWRLVLLCASSWVQGLREHVVYGDTCPPLVLFLCFNLGLRGPEDVWCVGTLVPLSCSFSFSIRIWQDVEYTRCVGTLVPLSCHLFLDSGAQRMHSVWGHLSPSRAISSWTQGLRECVVCGDTCPPLVFILFFHQDLVGC